jgi:hypothetical protein
VILTWPTVAGRNYLVQFKDSLSIPTWSDAGIAVTATGSTMSFTNSLSSSTARFYRVQTQ